MKVFFISIALIFSPYINADIPLDVLEKYKNEIFVVTGIGSCMNIEKALASHFTEIYGLEADKILVDHSKFVIPKFINYINPARFKKFFIYHNAPHGLLEIINPINKPITFLLSSHVPDLDAPKKENSVLQELDQIKKHHINTHTILIDYINWVGTIYFGNITLESIKTKLLEINGNYNFRFEKGGHIERDTNAILAAYIEN